MIRFHFLTAASSRCEGGLEGLGLPPLLDLHQAGIRGHAAGPAGLRPVWGEDVQTTADLDCFSRNLDELELCAGLVGLDDALGDQGRNVRRADDRTAIVE